MTKHSLPWTFAPYEKGSMMGCLCQADGQPIVGPISNIEADAILAVVNPTAKLVEAAEAVARSAEPVRLVNAVLKPAIAEYRKVTGTTELDDCRCGMGERCGPNNCDFGPTND